MHSVCRAAVAASLLLACLAPARADDSPIAAAPGDSTRVGGKALVVWKKQPDGIWRRARDMGSADAPAGP